MLASPMKEMCSASHVSLVTSVVSSTGTWRHGSAQFRSAVFCYSGGNRGGRTGFPVAVACTKKDTPRPTSMLNRGPAKHAVTAIFGCTALENASQHPFVHMM